MKTSFSFILSFLLLYISIEPIIQVNASSQCWEHHNPLKPWEKTLSSVCGNQKTKPGKSNLSDDLTASILAPTDAFQIVFTCGVPDQVLCGKAKNAFVAAGKTLASVINFNTKIVVNATFTSFCKALNECSGKILGAAGAARTIPLQDNDGQVRQYPQALAKQFLLNPQPMWGPFDIQAFFNAEADLFFGDGQITPNQFDFQYIITHELIHGLGFASSWNSYFSDDAGNAIILTPDPAFLNDVTSMTDPATFTGFEETAFDKYMVNAKFQPAKKMSDFTASINTFTPIGTKFPRVADLLNQFSDSPQFSISTGLLADSQTPKTFAFQPHDAKTADDIVFLETNLSPFQQGSSISHLNIKVFNNSVDFLLVFSAKLGVSLEQVVQANGGTGPVGPKLLSVLETLGYATANNPNPYKPSLPGGSNGATNAAPQPNGGSNMNQNPASSANSLISSSNILYIFIIVTVTLVF